MGETPNIIGPLNVKLVLVSRISKNRISLFFANEVDVENFTEMHKPSSIKQKKPGVRR